jgi:hypothetical protein
MLRIGSLHESATYPPASRVCLRHHLLPDWALSIVTPPGALAAGILRGNLVLGLRQSHAHRASQRTPIGG